jgi:hypothetical protein
MFNTNSGYSLADIAAATGGGNNRNNDGLFGDNSAWWIIILLLFGWGRNGFGGFGEGSAGFPASAPWATPADVRSAIDQQTLTTKLDQQTYGLADSTYALTSALTAGFNGVDNAICTLGYQALQNTNAIQTQLADCCCGIKGEIKDVAYGNERNSWNISKQISDCCCDLEKMNMQNRFDAQAYNCNTLQAIDKVGDRIIDYLANEKTQALRDENFALRLQASQAKQNEFLISRLGEKCPEPAYIVQPPQQVTFPTNCCGTVNYASNGCGCGSF